MLNTLYKTRKQAAITTSIILLLIMGIGLFVRLHNLPKWQERTKMAMYQGDPLLTTFDGYYYMTLARDIVENKYHPIDEKRGYPDCPKRPSPPPLISVLAAAAVIATPFSLNWIGAVMPSLLGVFLAIPLYLLGRQLNGRSMGYCAAAIGILMHNYVYRSSLGWFDTDCLNVTFTMLLCYLLLRFGQSEDFRKYIYLSASCVVAALFFWWWDQTPDTVLAIFLSIFLTSLIGLYRPSPKEGWIFLTIIICAGLSVLALKGFHYPFLIYSKIVSKFSYISKQSLGDFPNIGISITEQAKPSLKFIIEYTTFNQNAFIVACAGISGLIIKRPKEMFVLFVPTALGLMSFLFSNRFLIFLTPTLALGSGFFISELWKYKKKKITQFSAAALFIILLWITISQSIWQLYWPKIRPDTVSGLMTLQQITPEDSVVWSSWTRGYQINYFGERATISDGQIHSGERNFYLAQPLVTKDFRYAANFINFYVRHGTGGVRLFQKATQRNRADSFHLLRNLLTIGPENAFSLLETIPLNPVNKLHTTIDWLHFLYPSDIPPIYLFFHERMLKSIHWWYWFGNWNIGTKESSHPFYHIYKHVVVDQNKARTILGLSADLSTGQFKIDGLEGILSQAVVRSEREKQVYKFEGNSKILHVDNTKRFAVLQEEATWDIIFNKLFVREEENNYFTPIGLSYPSYHIWKVDGDRIPNDMLSGL